MSFNSLLFLVFLPFVIGLHWAFPAGLRWVLLLAASYIFYMSWNAALILLILAVTLVTYVSARMIAGSRSWKRRRIWLGLALVICLGSLISFKYLNFFVGNASALLNFFGLNVDGFFVDIILPVGISFYTFQALSYVIDVYRGTVQVERHLGYYALFVAFFPQLVAGPIERSRNLLPQLRSAHHISPDDLQAGFGLLLSGFFHKVVVADFAAEFVTSVFSASTPVDGGAVAFGTILFSIQIYCDFHGYTLIAAGSARFLGISLMKNFDSPYLARGIHDFWRRWHISLTSWFTDYVYIPLGGSRHGKGRRVLAIVVVFLLSGLWHGAAWTFVVWGAIHALYLIVEILLRADRQMQPEFTTRLGRGGFDPKGRTRKLKTVVAICGTFLMVNFAWIFFRAESLEHAFLLIQSLFSSWDVARAVALLNIEWMDVVQLVVIVAMLRILPALRREQRQENATQISGRAMISVYVIMAIALSWLIQLGRDGANAFIYFQF